MPALVVPANGCSGDATSGSRPIVFEWVSPEQVPSRGTPPEQLTDGPIGVGTRVRVVALFMPPRRIVLRGENATTLSIDEIVVDQDGAGCRVSYRRDAEARRPSAAESD